MHTQTYPLTSPQQDIWFDQLRYPDLPLYNIGGYLKIKGSLDPTRFETALKQVIQDNDALRTILQQGDNLPQQTFPQIIHFQLDHHDFSTYDNPHQHAMNWMTNQLIKPFQLYNQPLFQFSLCRLSPNDYYWFNKYHHLIVDGWAISLIVQRVAAAYNALLANTPAKLQHHSYIDFINYDQAYLNSTQFTQHQHYWHNQYRQLPEPLITPHHTHNLTSQRLTSQLQRPFYNQLINFAKQHQATIFHILLGVFYCYFVRTTHRPELIIGLPTLNRNNAVFKQTIGLFTTVSPTRLAFGTDLNFLQLLPAIKHQLNQNYRHQRYPLSELQRQLGLLQTGRQRFFDILLSYEKHTYDILINHNPTEAITLANGYTQTPLTLFVREFHYDQDVRIDFDYQTSAFTPVEIERLQARFKFLLHEILQRPQTPINLLQLMPDDERQQLLIQFNNTATNYPHDQTIADLFEQQVETTPEATALIFQNQTLTYRELNNQANQLAYHLKTLGVKAETLVGIGIERSLEMIIGLLGILKAGGAYLPFDPHYPKERLAFMLSDAHVTILLTQNHLTDNLPTTTAQIICLDTDWQTFAYHLTYNPIRTINSNNLAYVSYTSGSTGQPKGVCIMHQGVTRLVKNTNYAELNAEHIFLQLAPLAFDASTFEIWASLLNGAQLIIAPPQTLSLEQLGHLIQQHQITTLWLTAGLFHLMIDKRLADLKPVRQLLSGGDTLSVSHVRQALQQLNHCQLINAYGPTENTTFTSCYPITTTQPIHTSVPIGRPIANTQIYILDQHLQLMPIGVPGELHIGGAGLARGYLNRPDLTAEKFINNPFSNNPNARLYKTGDIARYLPDGNLEFLGRLDNQVKIRGYRIELGEIEAALAQHSQIRQVIVIVQQHDAQDKYLIAYLVPNSTTQLSPETLRHFLQQKLPDYMIPAFFITLTSFPITPNGKIDRHALPAPEQKHLDPNNPIISPRTPVEELLIDIWAPVLHQTALSIHDNFFELGGHSLLATQVISRLRDTLSIELQVQSLFEYPTIAQLADHIETIDPNAFKASSFEKVPRPSQLPLSFAQQRLWFLDQLEGPSAAYNIPFALRLHGTLQLKVLQRSLLTLIHRHESLHTRFPNVDGKPIQYIDATIPLLFTLIDLQNIPSASKTTIVSQQLRQAAQYTFNLATGPLFHTTLWKLNESEHILLLNMHHIISDGWSISVLFYELSKIYNNFINNQPNPLDQLPIQYIDFVCWQQQWLTETRLEQQLNYWQQQLLDAPPLLELPTDRSRPPRQSYQGATYEITINSNLTDQLKQLSYQHNTTLFMTLIAAYATLLKRYSGQDDIVIGYPIANRHHSQTESIIGFFVNTLVLRLHLPDNLTFQQLLAQVRQAALDAHRHQEVPFERLVDALHLERNLSYTPIFQVMAVFENMPIEELHLEGLTVTPLPIDNGTTKFDLNFHWRETEQGLWGALSYNTALFEPITIKRMLGHFETLLTDIVASPQKKISALRLLTATERNQLFQARNTLAPTQPFTEFDTQQLTIPDRFEYIVQHYSDHIAVKTPNYTWTYQELNNEAEKVAQTLAAEAALVERVALLFEQNAPMLAGLFGVLKTGKTYVPLDPAFPSARLNFILQDSQSGALLTHNAQLSYAQTLDCDNRLLLNFEDLKPSHQPPQNRTVSPASIAYLLYTSGTTGQPKGVIQNHRNVLHFIRTYTNNLHINANDRLTLFSSYCFDAAVMDIFAALLNGATLYPIDLKQAHFSNIFYQLIRQEITLYHSTPTVFRHLFLNHLTAEYYYPQIRLVVLGGEAVYQNDFELYRKRFTDDCLLVNGLGPTESTVTLQYMMNKQTVNQQTLVPVGYPVDQTEIILVDEDGEKTELYGEVMIKSAYLALGYWQQPALTKAAFPAHCEIDHERCYRTGDLGRLRADGSFEFVKRKDHQIKLRGYRIELGEIETVFNQHPEVKETVVTFREDQLNNPQLIAYLVPTIASTATFKEWRNFLQQRLPDYMIPAVFITLSHLPLLPNGKVNRRALPTPERVQSQKLEAMVPQSPLEKQLKIIWETLLNVRPIGRDDNFFNIGGHSLLAVTLLDRIEKRLGIKLPVIDLFQAPTIAQLAEHLQKQGSGLGWQALEAIQPQGKRSPLFFIGSTHYARSLAPWLSDEQPVYGLNIFGLLPGDGSIPSWRVEEIARKYLEDIQMVQPTGPYYLCGYCADAIVAFEIAQQIIAAGQHVAWLGFIDVIWESKRSHFLSISEFLRDRAVFGNKYVFHRLQRKLKFFRGRFVLLLNNYNKIIYQYLNKPLPLKSQHFLLVQAYYQALRQYVPKPFLGRVTLLLSQEWYLKYFQINNLDKFAHGGVESFEIPGYHDSLFELRQVKVLGQQVQRCLEVAGNEDH